MQLTAMGLKDDPNQDVAINICEMQVFGRLYGAVEEKFYPNIKLTMREQHDHVRYLEHYLWIVEPVNRVYQVKPKPTAKAPHEMPRVA